MTTTPPPSPSAPPTSGLAIASLVTGLTCISPAAIICGHMAMSQIKKSGGAIGGAGLALAGTILGYVSLAIALFSILPVLFIGARAWKNGSDRSACILNVRNVQQAVRGHQNMNSLNNGEPIDWDQILGPEGYMPKPVCPIHGEYLILDTYPESGTTTFTCPGFDHVLDSEMTEGW